MHKTNENNQSLARSTIKAPSLCPFCFLIEGLMSYKTTSYNLWFYGSEIWFCQLSPLILKVMIESVIKGHIAAPDPGVPGTSLGTEWSFRKWYWRRTVYKEAFRESDRLLEGFPCQILVCDLGQPLNISMTLLIKEEQKNLGPSVTINK